jgi:hypothetical protein
MKPAGDAKKSAGGTKELAGGFRLNERDESKRSTKNWASEERVTQDPTATDVEAAIERLDGRGFTDLSVSHGEGRTVVSLGCCGGVDGRVVCYLARVDDPEWDQEFHYLVEPKRGNDTFENVIGGQGTPLPERFSVARKLALKAARYFLAHGSEDPSLTWERY